MYRRAISIVLVMSLLLTVSLPNCVMANEGTNSASMSVTASNDNKTQIIEPSFNFPVVDDNLFKPEVEIKPTPEKEEIKVPATEIVRPENAGNITKGNINDALSSGNDSNIELSGSGCGFKDYVEFSGSVTEHVISQGVTSVDLKGFGTCEESLRIPASAFEELQGGFRVDINRDVNIINVHLSQNGKDVVLTDSFIEVGTPVSPVNNMLRFVSDSNGDKLNAKLDDDILSFKINSSDSFSLGATEGKLVPSKPAYPYEGTTIKPGAKMILSNTALKQSPVAVALMNFGVLNSWFLSSLDDTEYTVNYFNNKRIGTGIIKVDFTGKLSGWVSTNFEIVPKGTNIDSISTSKKSACVQFNKQPIQTSGYQVEYSTHKDFNDSTLVDVGKGKSRVTIDSLKPNKTYYARIRTYKVKQGMEYYSMWSKPKKFKTK